MHVCNVCIYRNIAALSRIRDHTPAVSEAVHKQHMTYLVHVNGTCQRCLCASAQSSIQYRWVKLLACLSACYTTKFEGPFVCQAGEQMGSRQNPAAQSLYFSLSLALRRLSSSFVRQHPLYSDTLRACLVVLTSVSPSAVGGPSLSALIRCLQNAAVFQPFTVWHPRQAIKRASQPSPWLILATPLRRRARCPRLAIPTPPPRTARKKTTSKRQSRPGDTSPGFVWCSFR